MAPYTFDSSHTTIDHLNKHFPTIYLVSQQHILRDLYHRYNSFWLPKDHFFGCSVLKVFKLTSPLSRHLMRYATTFRSATTPLAIVSEKICSHNMNQKLLYLWYRSRKMCCWQKMVFRLQTPLITSWFRENIWLNAANSAFSRSLHKNVGGQKHFLKGSMCRPPFFLPLPLLGLIFKRHLSKITWKKLNLQHSAKYFHEIKM
jgi:hypothetical protein